MGKIKRDKQIKISDIYDKKNSFSVNLTTTLDCNLQEIENFRNRFHHVKSWSRTLSPGSIWEFNFKHYLGNRVDLNSLWNIQCNNPRYTSNFIFVIETVGDRRSSIRRNGDNTVTMGYSPVNILTEFNKELTYLSKLEDEEDFLTVGSSKRDKSFDEDSELSSIFQPERRNKFTVDFQNIEYNDEPNPDAEFTLEYNKSLLTTSDAPSSLTRLTKMFEAYGANSTNITEDDLNIKLQDNDYLSELETLGDLEDSDDDVDGFIDLDD